jgi:hypothetical protein
VSRVPSEEESQDLSSCNSLSQLQKEKFSHFFTHLLDWDKDSLISAQDFDALSEVNLMHVLMYRPMQLFYGSKYFTDHTFYFIE